MNALFKVLSVLCIAACVAAIPLPSLSRPHKAHSVARWLNEASQEGGEPWALLIAGSDGWNNYRHQADVCHAYQILIEHGVPKNRIVTMMYDDIADNRHNKHKGQIFNEPDHEPDAYVDVYKGVSIDYRKGDVTPDNFLAVLSGDADKMKGKGTGRVVGSGPNDRLFVYFADHGGPGAIAFPQHFLVVQPLLHADHLMSTIVSMHENNKYKQMTVYIEACESGSMFNGLLPSNISVYGVTAANPVQPSYACYSSSKVGTYLGDCFSNHWMENADIQGDLNKETLQSQYDQVKERTTTSMVCQYGDLSIAQEGSAEYEGDAVVPPKPNNTLGYDDDVDAVPSYDVPLHNLRMSLENSNSIDEQQEVQKQLDKLVESRKHWDVLFKDIAKEVAGGDGKSYVRLLVPNGVGAGTCKGSGAVKNFDCFRKVVAEFNTKCGRFDDYGLSKLSNLRRICDQGLESRLPAALDKLC